MEDLRGDFIAVAAAAAFPPPAVVMLAILVSSKDAALKLALLRDCVGFLRGDFAAARPPTPNAVVVAVELIDVLDRLELADIERLIFVGVVIVFTGRGGGGTSKVSAPKPTPVLATSPTVGFI